MENRTIPFIIVASGMSSSRPILNHGQIDWSASRRVEFRVRTNAEEKLSTILEMIGDNRTEGLPHMSM